VVMSPRPGRIADVVDVSAPRPRSLASMATPEFMTATQRIREKIYGNDSTSTAHRPTL